jgi:hypothetical protein
VQYPYAHNHYTEYPGNGFDIHQEAVQQPTKHPAFQSIPEVQPSNYERKDDEPL